MRLALCLGVLAACSIPDKRPATGDDDTPMDAGVDAIVDSDAPDTKIDDQPAQFSNTTAAAFKFSSTDPSATFLCRIDDGAPEPCRSPFSRVLSDGQHSFSVRAIDPAGNMDKTPAERVWTIDTVAPDTQLVTFPPSADNSVMAVFTFKSAERNVSFDCQLDSGGFVPCTSGASFGPVADGTHAFSVRARDRAGNLDPSPAIYAWTVNTSTPDTTLLTHPDAASPQTTASFTFFSPDAGGGATFTCALDGAAFAACTSPRAFTGLAEGPHTFQVRVRDAVGNLDPSPATFAWTVDLTPPQTTISDGPSGATGSASASFVFAASEPDVTFACSLDGGSFADCTSPASFTALAQGAHSFAVRATDAAGHPDASPATRSWTVDTVAPDLTITSGPAATSGPRISVVFAASDGTVTCSLDGAAFTACASPLATNLPAGMHSLTIRAIDGAANMTTVSRSWTVACAAPAADGAAGLLHLDDTGQTLANAVAGGAPATLGDSDLEEPSDPSALAAGRFGGALSFGGAARVAWPVALPAQPDLTIELWANPSSVAGARELVSSGDGRAFVRVTAVSPTTVRFSVSIVEAVGGATRTVQSAVVDAGAWHHVIASLQAPSLRLWVDGARTELATVALDTPVALDALRLGGTGGAAYDGALDEVWLAQTAIASDEAALQRYCPL
jgi:hypothetical protein